MPKRDLFPLNLIFRSKPPDLILMGLGNPGQEYISTRHNVGFWLVDKMSLEYNIDIKRKHQLVQFGEGVLLAIEWFSRNLVPLLIIVDKPQGIFWLDLAFRAKN